ncbi:MAG TPA: phosphodiester glycosidase family protein [Sphingobacteriaceae bacterium]
MKFLIYAIALIITGCSSTRPVVNISKQQTLLDKTGWVSDTIRKDLVWYQYKNVPDKDFPNQTVNVLSFDPKLKIGKLFIAYDKNKDSLSAFADMYPDVKAGINGTYFLEKKDGVKNYLYLRLNGVDLQKSEVPSDHVLSWKNKAMFTYDNNRNNFKISYTPSDISTEKSQNILTGAPMLIYNYDPVGLKFVDTTGVNLSKLYYEDPIKHQGIRHPRTAIATTGDGKILLITVDGRNKNAVGMSAKELTAFLKRYFNPKSAMNIDGGGSTTMFVKGQPYNGTVNYPTDNKRFDHFGQRKVETVILID